MSIRSESAKQLFELQLRAKFFKIYSKFSNRDILIWGTGNYGKFICNLLKSFNMSNNIKGFCNTYHDDTQAVYVENIPVFSPKSAVAKYHNAVYIIASDYVDEILEYVRNSDFSFIETYVSDRYTNLLEKQLIYYTYAPDPKTVVGFNYTWFELYDKLELTGKLKEYKSTIFPLLEDDKSREILQNRFDSFLTGNISYVEKNPVDPNQYFFDECYKLTDDEVLFDCGGFTGDTVLDFIKLTQGLFKKIISFEPDEKNFQKLKNLVQKRELQNIEIKNQATGRKQGKIGFVSNGNMVSKVVERQKDGIQVDIVALDDYLSDKPTIIKMDVEGFEFETLKGAENIIRTLKPKLAICIYHKILDFYEIPVYLKSIVPEYKFKVRQHEPGFCETVLYAY
ncbi:FkbM family methyltransferase [Faecalibacillus faecis]|uniref:FkbM family methyltransferase n=1 Tax=Faecalibacillus faecis TaxID=1982628 RepID=UPI00387096ED